MQLYKIALCLLLLPVIIHADSGAQKNNISIKAAVCTENIALDMYKDSKGNPLQEILHIENVFKSKGLVPVWVEITNTTDSTQQVINQSSDSTQKNKKLFINYYKRSPMWRFISMFLLLTAIFDGIVFYDFKNEYKESLALQPWDELTLASKLTAMRGTKYATQAAVLTAFSALINLGGWWLITDSNKRLGAAFDKIVLQESLVIEPGKTVKKLIILGAEKKFVLDVVDMSTQQSLQQFEYKCGIAEQLCQR